MCAVIAMMGTVDGTCGRNSFSSGVRPENDIKIRVSFYELSASLPASKEPVTV